MRIRKRENAKKLTPKEAQKLAEEIGAALTDGPQAKPARKNAPKANKAKRPKKAK
jgi:hypothetical protein